MGILSSESDSDSGSGSLLVSMSALGTRGIL